MEIYNLYTGYMTLPYVEGQHFKSKGQHIMHKKGSNGNGINGMLKKKQLSANHSNIIYVVIDLNRFRDPVKEIQTK